MPYLSDLESEDPYERFGEPERNYGRKGHVATRVVWDYRSGEPIRMSRLEELTGDEGDEGFYGLHIGDEEWLPILCRDYGRPPEAQLIEFDMEGMLLIEDPNPMDKDSVPESYIVVWTEPEIPLERILFVRPISCPMEELEWHEDEDSWS